MYHVLKDLKGLSVLAIDEEAGELSDILFDDQSMTLRYFVVDMGTWLDAREALISPLAIKGVYPAHGRLVANLSKQEIEASPALQSHPPVSTQYEEVLAKHHTWSPYWGRPMNPAEGAYGLLVPSPEVEWQSLSEDERERLDQLRSGDPHLQSASEVEDYAIHTVDGDVGHVKDLLVEDKGWRIKFLVVKTGSWLRKTKVVVDCAHLESIEWAAQRVRMTLNRSAIKTAPRYNAKATRTGLENALSTRAHCSSDLERSKHP
jgi:uncharacterized protein YrrD